MIARRISSLQHPLVKRLVRLRESRAFRLEENEVLITGKQVVLDIAAFRKLKILISSDPLEIPAEKRLLASPEVMKKIIDLPSQEGVAAVVDFPAPASLKHIKRLIVLESLQDPGNVGTILRTALALGWEGAFLTPQTADPFNDKALRAARGAPLFLPFRQGSLEELKEIIQASALSVYIADVHGQDVEKTSFKTPLALILGHETQGPSSSAKNLGIPISIPMKSEMESLNVASAASILIYQLSRIKT